MIYKRIRNTLIIVLMAFIILIIGKSYLSNLQSVKNIIPKSKIIYKTDLTEIRIKQVLATNKLQSLSISFTAELRDKSFKSFNNKYIDNISKFFTTKDIIISKNYTGIFLYDLSKIQFTNNLNGNYDLCLNMSDIELNIIEIGIPETSEYKDLMGYGYTSDEAIKLSSELNELAKKKLNTYDDKVITLNNTRDNLLGLLQNSGVDINKINIKLKGV